MVHKKRNWRAIIPNALIKLNSISFRTRHSSTPSRFLNQLELLSLKRFREIQYRYQDQATTIMRYNGWEASLQLEKTLISI